LRRCPHRQMTAEKIWSLPVIAVFVLTRFGDAGKCSEIRGLELRPEPTPRAFVFRGLLESG
jgi:hypothetical protein